MPEKKKTTKEQLITTHKSVHVVFFSCAHCGDEIEDIKMCPSCGEPMKVINVVEKFGEEAEKFLEQVKKNLPVKSGEDEEEEEYISIDKEEPNIILMGGADATVDDGGIDPTAPDDGDGLDIIFPSDDDGEESHPKVEALDDSELSKALEQLDEEDDTSSEDFDAFGGGEVPEL